MTVFKPKYFSTITIALLMTLTTACSTTKKDNAYTGYTPTPTNLTALDIVAQNTQQALNAQQMLTKYTKQQSALLTIKQADFESDELALDYIGKPQPLLNSIAIKYGYRFLEFGTPIHVPTVNFTNVYTTPHNILVMVNAQLKDTASVGLDKNQKVITLTYKDHN